MAPFKGAPLRPSRFIVTLATLALLGLAVGTPGALAAGRSSGYASGPIRVRVVSQSPHRLVGRSASLSAGPTLAATPGQELVYRWSIVKAPRGSHARLSGASLAHPRLRPDRPGRYVLRVTIGRVAVGTAVTHLSLCGSGCVTHRITVSAGIPSGPLGVPIHTIWNDNGLWGVQVGSPGSPGSQFYAAPTQTDALQLVVLDRGTLASVENESFTNDAAGARALFLATWNLPQSDLVIITKPDPLVTNSLNDPSPAQAINTTLAHIGVSPVPAVVSTGVAGWSPTGGCSAFSAIGVPGLPVGQGQVNPCIAGINGQGYLGGELKGYLRQDLSLAANYMFVDDARVPFDTGDPDADPAVVTVGSDEPGSSVPKQTYTSANLSGGAGFFVVILDAGNLALQTQQTFSDTETDIARMGTLLSGWSTDPDALIIVRSIGKVGPQSAPLSWNQVGADLANFGASWFYFQALNGSSSSQYAQVGPGGAGRYPSRLAQIATQDSSGSGRLTGLLARDNSAQFYPDESYPVDLTDPNAPLAGTLAGIVSLPPHAWPDRNTPLEQAVLNCIALHIDPDGPLPTPIESNYTNQNLINSWSGWATEVEPPATTLYKQLTKPDSGCDSFSHSDFLHVARELYREWTEVPQVWAMIAGLQSPLLDSQGNAAAIASITDTVDDDFASSSQQVQVDGLGVVSDLLWAISGVPGLDAIAGPMNVLAGGLALADAAVNSNSGANLPDSQIATTGADLGATLEAQYTAAIQGLGNIGDILVSDPTKLRDAAVNAAGLGNGAADWKWSSADADKAADQLLVAARRTAYEKLFPLSYSLWQLLPASSLQDVNGYKCAELISTPTIDEVETWTPFSSVDQLDTFSATAGVLLPPEQWLFAGSDQTVLNDWGSPPARVPGDDLLNKLFGPAPPQDVQIAPLFTPLQFAVDAYDDGTANTIGVSHYEASGNGNFCKASTGS